MPASKLDRLATCYRSDPESGRLVAAMIPTANGSERRYFLVDSYSRYAAAFGADALVLVADAVEIPGNLGTLIRTVDAANADCLLLTSRRARPSHPAVYSARAEEKPRARAACAVSRASPSSRPNPSARRSRRPPDGRARRRRAAYRAVDIALPLLDHVGQLREARLHGRSVEAEGEIGERL